MVWLGPVKLLVPAPTFRRYHKVIKINSAVLSFVERLSSFGGSKCIRAIGTTIFGTSISFLCREVYHTVSLSRWVHYRRFHCIKIHDPGLGGSNALQLRMRVSIA